MLVLLTACLSVLEPLLTTCISSGYPSCRASQGKHDWGRLECDAFSVDQWHWPSEPVQQHHCDGLKYRTVKQNTVDIFLTTGTHRILGHGNIIFAKFQILTDMLADSYMGAEILDGFVAFSFVVAQEKFWNRSSTNLGGATCKKNICFNIGSCGTQQ
jgi:hypothetical protein